MTAKPLTLVDARGLICPEPVMMLHAAVRDAASGDLIKVLATDPASERDIEKFCHFLNHGLVSTEKEGQLITFIIRKGDVSGDNH